MTRIVTTPTRTVSLVGGSFTVDPNACTHAPAALVDPWIGEPGTAGRVAVVGVGKMGTPLVGQFASHGWHVTAIDVRPSVVDALRRGESPLTEDEEPGLRELLASAHADGRLDATVDAAEGVSHADVVVLIVPVVLTPRSEPDLSTMDAAVASILAGLRPGVTVLFETTLPVGTTRNRYLPRIEEATGLRGDEEVLVAFSPERLYSGNALRNLATYPKLVGGVGPTSGERAARFYASVLDTEIVLMSSSDAAEFSKLADTTYRDVNIALANEFAAAADLAGVDVVEVIAAANSQPYSHIHEPGLGVGGHCIPVYPHFLLSTAPSLSLVRLAREVNDTAISFALETIEHELGALAGATVLLLGLTYRAGVREVSYSQARPLIAALRARGADVSAFDPLMSEEEVRAFGAEAWRWGQSIGARAIVTQTADPKWRALDRDWFPSLEVLVDGRNSLRQQQQATWPEYRGIGRGDLRRAAAAP